MGVLTRIKQAAAIAKENSPVLLTIANGVGTITAVVLSARAGWKANDAIRKAEKEKGEKLTPQEKAKVCWKIFLPTGVATAGAIGSGIGATASSMKKTTAISAVASASEMALDELREKVKEKVGDKKAEEIDKEIDISRAEKVAQTNPDVIITDGGNSLFIESYTGTVFRSSAAAIERGCNQIDHRLAQGEMSVPFNDLREEWGLPPVDVGDDVYFTDKNRPAVIFRVPDYRPVLVNGEPYAVVSFAKGAEPKFWT